VLSSVIICNISSGSYTEIPDRSQITISPHDLAYTVEPLFTYSIGQWFYLLQKAFVSIFSLKPLDYFLPNIESQPGKSYHPSILKELEVMDNFNPNEPIPQSPHETLFGLCTLIYVLGYSLRILWIVHMLNLIMLSEVRKSNLEYIYRVMRSGKLVRKLKVCTWRST
jgi:hypothetical protein